MKHRTRAFWPTRIILAIGFIATALAVLAASARMDLEPFLGPDYPDVLGLPSNVLLAVSGVALAVIGLVWMLSIFRGPRDEPSAWRYRDR